MRPSWCLKDIFTPSPVQPIRAQETLTLLPSQGDNHDNRAGSPTPPPRQDKETGLEGSGSAARLRKEGWLPPTGITQLILRSHDLSQTQCLSWNRKVWGRGRGLGKGRGPQMRASPPCLRPATTTGWCTSSSSSRGGRPEAAAASHT